MKLSKHFSLEELTVTSTGLDNKPGSIIAKNLEALAETLEAVRIILLENPIIITSGFRSSYVNAKIGGAKNSAHMLGLAADFKCPRFGSPLEICRAIAASRIEYDQLIHEYGSWVHIGIGGKNRRQNLTIDKLGTRDGHLSIRT